MSHSGSRRLPHGLPHDRGPPRGRLCRMKRCSVRAGVCAFDLTQQMRDGGPLTVGLTPSFVDPVIDPVIRGPRYSWTPLFVEPVIRGPRYSWTLLFVDPVIRGPRRPPPVQQCKATQSKSIWQGKMTVSNPSHPPPPPTSQNLFRSMTSFP